ncbi:hypothetical protein GJ496_006218 [Pomphorhynchus laevis]|nr:hypothetical protein GJ496_006218 [Pomphorhynchus laevis]
MPDALSDTLAYCERFSTFRNSETILEVREALSIAGGGSNSTLNNGFVRLHQFETAALANLCPESAEEAKTLIPSLTGKIDDDQLQRLLDDIRAKKTFQY